MKHLARRLKLITILIDAIVGGSPLRPDDDCDDDDDGDGDECDDDDDDDGDGDECDDDGDGDDDNFDNNC